jgi:hypothetical protein
MADLKDISTEELLAMRERATSPRSSLADVSTEDLLKMRQQAVNTERPKTAMGESFIRGAAQGASAGWIDEGTAALGAAYQVGKAKLGLRGDVSYGDAYSTLLNHIRSKDDAAKADNPKTFGAGAVTGGVASVLTPGIAAKGLGEATKAGGALAKFGQGLSSLKGAAAYGAVSGAGMSEANPFESPDKLKEFATDVGVGGATGLAFGAAGKLIGKATTALKPSNLDKTANIKTLKAAGYMGPDLKKMSEGQKQQVGEALHRLGVVKFGSSLDDVVAGTGAAKEKAGQEIGAALDSVDDLVKQAKAAIDEGRMGGNLPAQAKENLKAAVDKQFQFNMNRIGDRIQKELIAPNAKNPMLKAELGKLTGLADDFRAGGSLTMREGNVLKGTQGKVTKFHSDTVPEGFKREVYDIIKTEIDDIVAKTGNLEAAVGKSRGNILGAADDVATRNRTVADTFGNAKRDYGALARTEDVATNRLGQLQANREISLTDTIAGVGGLATGNPGNAIVLGGLNKMARQYGDSAMAATARKTAEIIRMAPEALGPFAGVLEAAAKRGSPALAATHLKLTRDPDFQRILADYENSKSPVGRRIKRLSE